MTPEIRRRSVLALLEEVPGASAVDIARTLGIQERRVQQIVAQARLSSGQNAGTYRSRLCPGCSRTKSRNAALCRPCTLERRDRRSTCPRCRGRKRPGAEICATCRRKDVARSRICPACGGRKKPTSKRCASCHKKSKNTSVVPLRPTMTLTCGICHRSFERSVASVLKGRSQRTETVVCSTKCRAINAARARNKEK